MTPDFVPQVQAQLRALPLALTVHRHTLPGAGAADGAKRCTVGISGGRGLYTKQVVHEGVRLSVGKGWGVDGVAGIYTAVGSGN